MSEEERSLLTEPKWLKDVYDTKRRVLDLISDSLGKRKEVSRQEDQYGVGWNYKYGKKSLFVGFNPWYNDEHFFSLCIQEDASTDKDDKLYYNDGWYYVPVQDSDCVEGDEKVLTDLRDDLKGMNIVIPKEFAKFLRAFYTLKAKIADLAAAYAESKFSNFEEYEDGDDKGFCFGESDSSDYFLGLSFEHSIFSLDIRQDLVDTDKCKDLLPNGTYYAFLLSDQKSLFNDFLLSATGEELQKNFNALVDAAKRKPGKYRK